VACLLAIAAPAVAEDADYARSGFYVGLAGTYALPMSVEDEFNPALSAMGASGSADNSLGINARIGYRVIPYFAYEAQYEGVTGFDVKAMGTTAYELRTNVATLNLKGYYPVGRFQPYLLLGLGMMFANGDDNVGLPVPSGYYGFASRFGLGLDFHITDKFLFTLEPSYVLPAGDTKNFDYFSIGWGFQFRL